MRYIMMFLLASMVLTFGAYAGPVVKADTGVSNAAFTKIAFNHPPRPPHLVRPMPFPPPIRRPVPAPPIVRRPVFVRPMTRVVAPVITVAPPPPPPVVVAPAPLPVRHVRLPLAEPVMVESPAGRAGHYETRLRVAPSGERYEEQVWVAAP